MALLRRSGFRGRLPLVWILITCALLALVAVLVLRLGSERQRYAAQVLDLEGSRAALQRELAERQAAAGALADLRAEIARAEARQQVAAQTVRETEAQVTGLEARRKAADDALAAAAALQTDLAAARSKVEGAVREATELQQQLEGLRSDRDKLADAVVSLQRKRSAAEAQVADIEANRSKGMEELSRLDALLDRTRREVSEAQAREAQAPRRAGTRPEAETSGTPAGTPEASGDGGAR